MLRKLLAVAAFCLAFGGVAHAQSNSLVLLPGGCGTGSFPTSIPYLTIDTTGKLCTSASGGGGGGGTSSNFGSAFPTAGTAAGFTDGTNMVGARVTSGALSSGFTPPTSGLQQVQSFGMVWNGTTWDRATAASGGLSIQDQAAFTAGTSNFTPGGGVFNDTATLTSGQQGTYRMTTKRAQIMDVDTTGNALYSAITAPIPAGTNLIGKVGIDQTTPGTTNAVSAAGATSNASSAVATSSTNVPGVAYNYGYNGTTWDQLQVDGSKNLKTIVNAALPAGSNSLGAVGADPSKGGATPSSVAINVSTATTTQLVAISGSTKVYVTSYDVISGGTGNITFVYGTGSNCGTGTTSLTGAYNLTAQTGIAKGNGVGAVLVVPSGNALCVTTSAAVQMSGSVSYQQF